MANYKRTSSSNSGHNNFFGEKITILLINIPIILIADNRSSLRTLKQISRMVVRSYLPSIVQYSVYDSLPLPTGLKTYLAGGDFIVQLTGAEGNVYFTEDVN